METNELIRLFLPVFVADYFDAVDSDSDDDVINIYLDEKFIKPQDGTFTSKGFTPPTKIQDFPIRGKQVFLHIRRRKWLNEDTGEVVSKKYDLTHLGTGLTHDFVAFLKAAH